MRRRSGSRRSGAARSTRSTSSRCRWTSRSTPDARRGGAEASLAEAKLLASEHGVDVEAEIVQSRAIGEAIVDEATTRTVDLIVMGSAPRWRRQSRFFSPTVDYPSCVHAVRGDDDDRLPQGVLEEEERGPAWPTSDREVIVVGCGRGIGGGTGARSDRLEVTAIDENEDALQRLGEHWSGGFVVGHGMDVDVLREAGIEEADAVVVATNGDNTNLVVGQVAQKQVRHPDDDRPGARPGAGSAYASLGLRTISRPRPRSTSSPRPCGSPSSRRSVEARG